MKLLFDENLSPNLPNRLSDLFPDSLYVRDVGMKATILQGEAPPTTHSLGLCKRQ
jgi:predicted nuclease of predicted toxin-antitoxin system